MPSTELPDWFAAACAALREGDVAGWMAMYADDAVHEFPFAPADGVRRLEGRDAIERYMAALPGHVRFGDLHRVRVHEAGDTTIIEATAHHRRAADDVPFELDVAWFVTRRGGSVVLYRDYMNPTQLAAVMSGDG